MRIRNPYLTGLLAVSVMAIMNYKAFGNSVTLSQNGYSYSNGGEFTATSPDSLLNPARLGYAASAIVNGGFETFCMEFNEEFNPGGTYQYGVGAAAISGGGATGGAHLIGGVWMDPVSIGTAWLYRQFATGVLAGYDYSGDRVTSAGALQQAIWYLEGEQNDAGTGGAFVALAETTLGLSLAGIEADANGLYGVSALNLGNLTDNPEYPNQDQLVLTTPGSQIIAGSVADGGMTIALLGGALVGLGMLRRSKLMT